MVIDGEKTNKTLNRPENIDTNSQSFQRASHVQKEVPPSHNLQDHAYD